MTILDGAGQLGPAKYQVGPECLSSGPKRLGPKRPVPYRQDPIVRYPY